MATATKLKLSGSTDGKRILVAATATPGTTIHATGNGASTAVIDEVNLDLCNTSASAVTVTLEWGGTGTANNVVLSLDPYETRGYTCVLAGTGASANTVAAFASTGSVVNIGGWVDRYTL